MTAASWVDLVAKASMSEASGEVRTPDLRMSAAGMDAVLVAATRSPEKRPAMRKMLRTGLLIALVGRVRKPSKYCLSSNSNDQESMEMRLTLYWAARSSRAFIAVAV